MQLIELELTNWGPFYGTHAIPLGVDESAPVVLFRGENGRGKTTLLRAIVWALYGVVKEQDGRTRRDIGRMVNYDSLEGLGETEFGVRLRFSHAGTEYTLYRSAHAIERQQGRVEVLRPSADLIPTGGQPYPASQIPEVIGGILNQEISDFFLFDGEMLNRFEERLRDERSVTQGFVRQQVERALGLPFLSDLGTDLEAVLGEVNTNIEQALRRSRQHDQLSQQYRAKVDEVEGVKRDLEEVRRIDLQLTTQIDDIESQLARVEEIKDLYHERKSLELDADRVADTVRDIQQRLADRTEAAWWLPAADQLEKELREVEDQIVAAERANDERVRLQLKAEQIESQLAKGVCPTCGQSLVIHNEDELRQELSMLQSSLLLGDSSSLDDLRRRRDKLRRFSTAPTLLQWVHDQEKDIRRERLQSDKKQARIRQISELLSANTVEIDTLERTLIDLKAKKQQAAGVISSLDAKRLALNAEAQKLGARLADQPEVSEADRKLQKAISVAHDVVAESFAGFRTAMRRRVEAATSDLFRELTTEKAFTGVSISDDYTLAVTDHQGRALGSPSAGMNQILTMAFIGALAECSVDEAPMVMDTPFGRLDVGHRTAILEWVSTFDSQVILFVQSGEYSPERDGNYLSGKIGREYTIDRLSPNRSEVRAA